MPRVRRHSCNVAGTSAEGRHWTHHRRIWVQHPDNYDPSLDGEAPIRDIGARNEAIDAAGVRFLAGGLESASHPKSLREQIDGDVSITGSPYFGAEEHVGGVWVLRCADMDEGLAWGRKPVVCRVPVEVRAFLEIRQDGKSLTGGFALLKS